MKRTREIRKFHVVIVLRRLRKVLALLPKLIAFLPFLLPSPSSLLKVPIVLIQKLCYHGNMTSRFSLFCNTFSKTNHSIHIRSNGLTRFGFFPVSLSSCMICPKKMQQRGHFRDNFLLSWPKVDSIFRTFSLFLSLIVRQSKVERWTYERASELKPSKNHRLRFSCGSDGSQFHRVLEILKDTLLSN